MNVKGAILGMQRQTFIVHILTLYQCLNAEANLLYRPSFISSWYGAKAQNKSLSLLIINHNLGEYPVKVDVQVKINEGGKDYIFSGLGSSQRDDDLFKDYGGVIYKYNDQHIKLSFPFSENHADTGGLAYTGSDNLYVGPTNLLGPYKDGYVRTRVWLASDMPHIVLNKSVYMSETINYKDITHELGYYPDLLTVQTLLSNGYMSDGVGAVFMASTPDKYNSLSGVLYGYDESKIRLWVPTDYVGTTLGGGVFSAADGYKLGNFKSGEVKILAWNIQCSQQVFYKTFEVGDIDHDDKINFPFLYDWTNFLVSVQYKVPDKSSPNGGMVFKAAGTTQANNLSMYGGVIYAYTEKEVLLWRPTNGPVVYIGDRWGNGNSNQIANTAHVIIRVYHLHEAELSTCPCPETVGNATFNVSGLRYGNITVYTCTFGYSHSGGDLTRVCSQNSQWSGIVPACIDVSRCPYPEAVGNSTFNVTGLRYGDSIVYTCNFGYYHGGGDLTRVCSQDNQWSGIVPACIGVAECPYPETVGNSTFKVTSLRYGDSTVYTCNSGYSHGGGDLTRVCRQDSQWSGIVPACIDDSECLYPDTVGNATFNVTGLRYGDSIVYTCKSGYSHSSGDLTRICCRNGQWSGIVPTCKESKQQTKGSYEDIEEVLNNIRVQRKETSAYRRSLISVKDERLSSKVIGITGVIIFTILIGIIVVPDLMKLFKHLCCSRSTNK